MSETERNPAREEALELGAMLDRVTFSTEQMRRELIECRTLLARLGIAKPGCCNAPSHITQAQASRILGIGMPAVNERVKTGKLAIETHYGTKLIPMSEIVRELDKRMKAKHGSAPAPGSEPEARDGIVLAGILAPDQQ